MARTVKPRDDYHGDSVAVYRIIQAIDVDTVSPQEWRNRVRELLLEAFQLLGKRSLEQQQEKNGTAATVPSKRNRGK